MTVRLVPPNNLIYAEQKKFDRTKEVRQNKRISPETIIIFGDIAIGKNYEESDISLLIKKLYDTSYFSNISVELINNKLTVVVEENPIIDTISFRGEKAKKYQETITELLSNREKSSFLTNNVKTDVNLIKAFLEIFF